MSSEFILHRLLASLLLILSVGVVGISIPIMLNEGKVDIAHNIMLFLAAVLSATSCTVLYIMIARRRRNSISNEESRNNSLVTCTKVLLRCCIPLDTAAIAIDLSLNQVIWSSNNLVALLERVRLVTIFSVLLVVAILWILVELTIQSSSISRFSAHAVRDSGLRVPFLRKCFSINSAGVSKSDLSSIESSISVASFPSKRNRLVKPRKENKDSEATFICAPEISNLRTNARLQRVSSCSSLRYGSQQFPLVVRPATADSIASRQASIYSASKTIQSPSPILGRKCHLRSEQFALSDLPQSISAGGSVPSNFRPTYTSGLNGQACANSHIRNLSTARVMASNSSLNSSETFRGLTSRSASVASSRTSLCSSSRSSTMRQKSRLSIMSTVEEPPELDQAQSHLEIPHGGMNQGCKPAAYPLVGRSRPAVSLASKQKQQDKRRGIVIEQAPVIPARSQQRKYEQRSPSASGFVLARRSTEEEMPEQPQNQSTNEIASSSFGHGNTFTLIPAPLAIVKKRPHSVTTVPSTGRPSPIAIPSKPGFFRVIIRKGRFRTEHRASNHDLRQARRTSLTNSNARSSKTSKSDNQLMGLGLTIHGTAREFGVKTKKAIMNISV